MKTLYRIDTGAGLPGFNPGYSFGASFNSPAVNLDNLEGYSVSAKWSGGGSPVGILSLQASNNAFIYNKTNNEEDPNAVWTEITGSPYSVSADGSYFWNVADVYYRAFRLVYTRTSGTATASLYIFAKGIQ